MADVRVVAGVAELVCGVSINLADVIVFLIRVCTDMGMINIV